MVGNSISVIINYMYYIFREKKLKYLHSIMNSKKAGFQGVLKRFNEK